MMGVDAAALAARSRRALKAARLERRHERVAVGLIILDSVAFMFAYAILAARSMDPAGLHVPMTSNNPIAVAVVLCAWTVLVIASSRLYDSRTLFWGYGEFKRLLKSMAFALLSVGFAADMLRISALDPKWLLELWLLATASIAVGRLAFRAAAHVARERSAHEPDRVLVIGDDYDAARLVQHVEARAAAMGMQTVGFLSSRSDSGSTEIERLGLPRIGATRDVELAVAAHRIDTVLISPTSLDPVQLSDLLGRLRDLDVNVDLSAGISEILASRMSIREVAGLPLLHLERTSPSLWQLAVKRVVDIVASGLALVVLAPIWFVLGVIIKIDSPGPVLFRQTRVGEGGTHFGMLKFRTMFVDAEERLDSLREMNEADGPLFKVREDPRITRIGRFLRAFSIDEFPQLINVFVGDMSLIGPRPPLPREVELYEERHLRRIDVTPGMTGLWQVSGRSDLDFHEMVRLDLLYISNWSLGLDASILLRTIPAVLTRRGAY